MANLPINSLPVNPDLSVYGMALLLALGSGLLFGMVPIRQVLRANPWQIVKSGTSGAAGPGLTIRDLLLVVQIAICAVLVTSSLVALRGLARSLHSNFGFEPQNSLLVATDLVMAGYSGERVPGMQRRMLDALEGIPGVSAAGLSDRLPLGVDWYEDVVFKDSTTDMKMSNAAAETVSYDVSPGYFRAAGTALLAGRAFTWHDDKNAPRVAVVNREFARKVFGSEAAAVGSYYKRMDGTRIEVAGLVEDGKHKTLAEDPQPAMFLPILQSPSSSTWLIVRSSRDPQELTAGRGEHAAEPRCRTAFQHSHLEKAARQRSFCLPHRHHFSWSAGRPGRHAGGYRNLRHGSVFGEQADAGAGNSYCSGRAAEGSVAGRAGTRFQTAGIRFGGRIASRASGNAECWLSSCIRPLPAIRWCWPASFWRCRCWGWWPRGFQRNARCRSIL